jgi:Ca2+-binding EF-hand superfamily protein
MKRIAVAGVPILAILVAGMVVAEDKKEKGAADPPKEPEKKVKIVKEETVEKFIAAHDKDKDGFLTKEEMPERYQYVFDKLDTNKDGKLSKQELIDGWHLLHPRHRPADFVYVLIEMSDCDENCVQELQAIYDALQKLDKNRDGKIDVAELKAAREQIISDRVDRIMKRQDTNKDGKISKDEAVGEVRENFAEIDADGDGFITREELLKAMSAKPKEAPEDKPKDKEGK